MSVAVTRYGDVIERALDQAPVKALDGVMVATLPMSAPGRALAAQPGFVTDK